MTVNNSAEARPRYWGITHYDSLSEKKPNNHRIPSAPHQGIGLETFRRPVNVDAFSANPEATT